jgi:histidyl-tRNA synthetase
MLTYRAITTFRINQRIAKTNFRRHELTQGKFRQFRNVDFEHFTKSANSVCPLSTFFGSIPIAMAAFRCHSSKVRLET